MLGFHRLRRRRLAADGTYAAHGGRSAVVHLMHERVNEMRKLLLATVALVALALPANAVVVNLVTNPNSATGNFSLAPGGAAFNDQVVFGLSGGPQFVTIANATNTFASAATDQITNWVASIWSAGADQILNSADANPLNDDDVLLFGPQNAQPCVTVANCQFVGGSGTIYSPGLYYANFTGQGGGTSGLLGQHQHLCCARSARWRRHPRHHRGVRPWAWVGTVAEGSGPVVPT